MNEKFRAVFKVAQYDHHCDLKKNPYVQDDLLTCNLKLQSLLFRVPL
jgi:hypothetical protein